MLSDEGEGSEDARMQKVCFCDYCDDDVDGDYGDDGDDKDGAMVWIPGYKKFVLVFIVTTIMPMNDGDYDNDDDGDEDLHNHHSGLARRTRGTLGFS